jgi:hypothetical protein
MKMNTVISECPGCKLTLPTHNLAAHDRFNATGECWELYGELSIYNLERAELTFIHQLAVDAYGAQHSGGVTKNITTVFSLVGLYLFNEHGFTGRQVQIAHMNLSKQSIKWPLLVPPNQYWDMNVQDVLMADPRR